MDPRIINSEVLTEVTRGRIKIIMKLNLLIGIHEVPDSSLAYTVDYHDWYFSWFSLLSPR
jgi:hypothetical protein